jgi:hypothetical protein
VRTRAAAVGLGVTDAAEDTTTNADYYTGLTPATTTSSSTFVWRRLITPILAQHALRSLNEVRLVDRQHGAAGQFEQVLEVRVVLVREPGDLAVWAARGGWVKEGRGVLQELVAEEDGRLGVEVAEGHVGISFGDWRFRS